MSKLQEAGYKYVGGASGRSHDLVLRQVTDESKKFEWQGQEHYDLLGAGVVQYLERSLVSDVGLEELVAKKEGADVGVNVFCTPGLQSHEGPLLILVAGSAPGGHAGMWARSLCINNSLEYGSMLPYISRAKELGWAVLVTNPNVQQAGDDTIPGSESPHQHLETVWHQFAAHSKATHVLVVAHSYGGCGTVHLLKTCKAAQGRLSAIAFTDAGAFGTGSLLQETVPEDEADKRYKDLQAWRAVSPAAFELAGQDVREVLQAKARNFMASAEPLGTPLSPDTEGCICVSAGHTDHVWTSGMSIDIVFDFLKEGVTGTAAESNAKTREAAAARV